MPTLHLDALTATVALASLSAKGGDLTTLAQAVDEDWQRFAPDPATGSRHLISTMGNRQDCPPTGLPYYNAQLIQPGRIDAARRPIGERFMRGAPMLCAEVERGDDGYRLTTALLRISMHAWMAFDRAVGRCVLYLADDRLPDTALAAMPGRLLGEIVDTGHADGLLVTGARIAEAAEMRRIANKAMGDGVAVETELPEWTRVDFDPVYRRD